MLDSEDNSLTGINQTYKIWKKHSPFLYNHLQTFPLSSCSQTVEFFSDYYIQNDWKITNMLIGTNSLCHNALNVLTIALPTDHSLTDYSSYRQQATQSEIAGQSSATMGVQKVNISVSIPQASEILRARINPQNQSLIAVKTGGANAQLLVYDLRNKVQDLQKNALKLTGHDEEGFGLCWHPTINNKIISGSYDKKILSYDIIKEIQLERGWIASQGIQDVKWSRLNPNILGSAQKDQKICLWDNRTNDQKPVLTRKAHTGEVYSLDFNPFSQHLLISGGQDGDVCFWDLRNLSKKLHSFLGHNDSVNVVAWSPRKPLQFASGSSDTRVVIWDIQGLNQNSEQSSGNQITFIHGGHRSKVTDVSWGKENNLLGSTEQYNTLQVWRMNQKIEQK